MEGTGQERPRLRPTIDVVPLGENGEGMVGLCDQAGLVEGVLTLSIPAFFVAQLFDGTRDLVDFQAEYARRFGRILFTEELVNLISQLDEAHFLDTPRFAAFRAALVERYRAAPVRPMRALEATGADAAGLAAEIEAILAEGADAAGPGHVAGIIVPHLDWPRGRPCYARAYAALRASGGATRYVILGTNHFGSSSSVVVTTKDFQTPLGTVPADRDFIERLEAACGGPAGCLCENEFDHQNEHSVELQIPFIQHLAGDNPCTVVAALCPDPCGPTGTAPYDGNGVDLKRFATALGRLIRDDPTPTCIIAAADLSHVGMQFGDDKELDASFLESVADQDHAALARLEAANPEAFRAHLASTENPTRICSAGCIYTLATALAGATPERLFYHQADNRDAQLCVTCSAYAFRMPVH